MFDRYKRDSLKEKIEKRKKRERVLEEKWIKFLNHQRTGMLFSGWKTTNLSFLNFFRRLLPTLTSLPTSWFCNLLMTMW